MRANSNCIIKLTLILGILMTGFFLTACKKETPVSEQTSVATEETTNTTDTAEPAAETGDEPNTKSSLADTMTKENYPKVDGSTATLPLSQAVYQLATGASKEEAEADIIHTKTSNSYHRLMNGEVDLAFVYEPSEEVVQSMEESDTKLLMKPIGRDALVFMANASNPVSSLTEEQIVDIYSGKINNWKEVGGEDKEILAFQRPADSGSQTLMQKLVMGDNKMITGPNVISYESMEGILSAMVDYSNEGNTLGYSVYYYAKNMYEMPELKFMAVNGVEPSLESIYDKSYPFINEFYAVIREDEPADSNAHKLFDWITEEEGQSLVKDLGYVPENMEFSDKSSQREALTDNTIPAGYHYITASYSSHEGLYVGDVSIYQDDWKTVRSFKNAYAAGDTGLVKDDSLIPLGYTKLMDDGTYKLLYGIYSISQDKFVVDAVYDSIWAVDESNRFFVAGDSKENKVIDINGNIYASGFLSQEGFGVSKRGDYYWIYDYSEEKGKEKYSVYDADFSLIKEFYRDYDECTLYEDDGSVYFSKDMFMKHFGIKDKEKTILELPNLNNGDALINVYYNGKNMILDRNFNELAEKPVDEQYNSYYNIYNDIFSDAVMNTTDYISSGTFYDKNGDKITDNKGNSYDNIISESYYGYTEPYEDKGSQILYHLENNTLNILDYSNGNHDEINLKDWNSISYSYVYKDLVVLCNSDDNDCRTRIYKDNVLLMELSGWYTLAYVQGEGIPDSILLQSYGDGMNNNSYLLMDNQGNTLYQSKIKEGIVSMDAYYMQVVRGNYLYVENLDGDVFAKQLNNDLDSD